MATTYGYGGEFSSDEDVDRIEQAQLIVQSRSNDNFNPRPSAQQIEQTIEAIKNMSPEEDINLTDELLAGLLDHYKTQRGPIVDSTRKLYKKIILKVIREGPKQQDNETNGNSNYNNNNNNVSSEVIHKQKPQVIDSFSSDEEEPLASVIQASLKKRSDDHVINNKSNDDTVDQMEIDPEAPTGPVRETKQVDISTDDDDDEDSTSSGESESEDLNSESDILEVTPIKPPQQPAVVTSDKARSAASALSTPKRAHTQSSVKRQPLAHSTPKESVISTSKKPYTRSQRLAASRASTSFEKASDSFIDSKTAATSSNDGKRASRKGYILVAATIIVALLAYLLYHFRENIVKSTSASTGGQLFANKINFG